MTTLTASDTTGWTLIVAERTRQVTNGFPPAVDDQHVNGELAKAARCYLSMAAEGRNVGPPAGWPWPRDKWKPRDRASNLLVAGALYLAEADRLDRAGRAPQAAAVRRQAMAIATGLTRLLSAAPPVQAQPVARTGEPQ